MSFFQLDLCISIIFSYYIAFYLSYIVISFLFIISLLSSFLTILLHFISVYQYISQIIHCTIILARFHSLLFSPPLFHHYIGVLVCPVISLLHHYIGALFIPYSLFLHYFYTIILVYFYLLFTPFSHHHIGVYL